MVGFTSMVMRDTTMNRAECMRLNNKRYYQKNKEKRKEKIKQYRLEHKEELKEYEKQYRLEHKEKIKQYRLDNKDALDEYRKQYRLEHKEEINEYTKQYYQKNKEKKAEYRNQYAKTRRQNDPEYKLRMSISSIIGQALKRSDGSKFGESILQHLPYTIEELKNHIEKQWKDWMSWDNHGKYDRNNVKVESDLTTYRWHIDHITPQSKLPYDTMEHPNFQKCWVLDNLRPLEAVENIKKGNK